MTNDQTGAPTLDLATIDRLRQIEAFKPGIIVKLVESFTTNQSHFIDEAPELVAAGKFELLRIRLHALRGAAASLGALPLAAVAHCIELIAAEQPAQVITTLPALRAEFERAALALAAWAATPE